MKLNIIGSPKIIMENPLSKHNYFAWPTATRLQNGKIAVVASGFRLRHICPFGKTVIAFSEDDGKTYTAPCPVIDTALDDRDGGVATFGKSGVVVTSFNNTVEFQRGYEPTPYMTAYLDTVTPEEEERFIGSTFRISHDYGVTFGELYKSPVTSPHGPSELPDGSLIWVGRVFEGDGHRRLIDSINAYRLDPESGEMEFLGAIEDVDDGGDPILSCEPHQIVLEDGTIIVHIRVQRKGAARMFTVYQSESTDGGRSWSKPHILLDLMGGSPPHILRHSSGALICTYAYRKEPYDIKAMISLDNGKTWDTGNVLYVNGVDEDLGYPSTVELNDGSLITVFYAHPSENEPAVIMQQQWSF